MNTAAEFSKVYSYSVIRTSAKRSIFFHQISVTAKIVSTEIILLKNLNVSDHFHQVLVREIIT